MGGILIKMPPSGQYGILWNKSGGRVRRARQVVFARGGGIA